MASPGRPAPKVRRCGAERALVSIEPQRCPFESCSFSGDGTPEWLNGETLVSHINIICLSQSGTTLPVAMLVRFKLGNGCGLITSLRGCLSCAGKRGTATSCAPVARLLSSNVTPATSNLSGLTEVLSTRVEILEHVPKGVRIHWPMTVTETLEQFCSNPSQTTLCHICMLPKYVLRLLGRYGARAKAQTSKLMTGRLQRCQIREWSSLWEEARSAAEALRTKTKKEVTAAKVADRASRRVMCLPERRVSLRLRGKCVLTGCTNQIRVLLKN